jgi:hypothetical protein
MLAAHRGGGRTSCIAFARAWDRFTVPGKRDRPRRASERELLILATHLQASLLAEEAPAGSAGPSTGLAAVIADHQALVARRPPSEAQPEPDPERAAKARRRPGDPDRAPELRHRRGWAWTRVFRRYDDYERALQRLQAETPAPAETPARPDAAPLPGVSR